MKDNDMDKEELKTTNLWNVTLTADESGNPLYLTFGGVRYVKEDQQSASGQSDTTGKVKEVSVEELAAISYQGENEFGDKYTRWVGPGLAKAIHSFIYGGK